MNYIEALLANVALETAQLSVVGSSFNASDIDLW